MGIYIFVKLNKIKEERERERNKGNIRITRKTGRVRLIANRIYRNVYIGSGLKHLYGWT